MAAGAAAGLVRCGAAPAPFWGSQEVLGARPRHGTGGLAWEVARRVSVEDICSDLHFSYSTQDTTARA